jgi:hypothetical protein
VVLGTNLRNKNIQAVTEVGPNLSIPESLSEFPLGLPWLFWLWGTAEIINQFLK